MKKIIILFIVIIIFVIWIVRAPILSFYISKKLKVPVSIEKINISKSGLKLTNFKIKDKSRKIAFSSKNIDVLFSFKKIRQDPCIIDKIICTNNFLYIKCKNPICSSNNWTEIMGSAIQKGKKNKEVIVNKFILNNLIVEISKVGLIAGSTKHLSFDHLEFNNVNSKDGFPTTEFAFSIFQATGLEDFIKNIFKGNIFKKAFKPWKFFESNKSPPLRR